MSKSAQSTGDGQTIGHGQRAHLEDQDPADDIGGFRCRDCGFTISIDPESRIEYGHTRRAKNGGRCPNRPAAVDPSPAWGRPNND